VSGAAETILVAIREDPERSPRPAEALRLAVGLRMGDEAVELLLTGPGARVLADDASGFADADVLERHREALARAGQLFRVAEDALIEHPPSPAFHAEPMSEEGTARLLAAAGRHILF
jgi:hypothetical protein